ncbi:hypothetical protein H6P81_018861 [Aristolochia fimbriata]|uniref:Uncharacterized protein n=1 Tax=Aristolochia fimbriata TaxID=158543 RepID=A0AAV7E6C2_ARIFI|nr:hypothetical protein H6P81_018861 [Aristolochia fimbriata]
MAATLDEENRSHPSTFRQLLSQRLGFDEFVSSQVWQASVTELIGTAVLVFFLDAIAMSASETDTRTPNLLNAFVSFACIAIVLHATVPLSGGHLNPTVTFTSAISGLISPIRAAIYINAQCCGAVVAALALKASVGHAVEEKFLLSGCTLRVPVLVRGGTSTPNNTVGIETSQGLCLEIICTFFFLFGPVFVTFDTRLVRAYGSVAVLILVAAVLGLLTFVSLTVTDHKKGYSGASMNPAKCLGPALVHGGHLWNDLWVFWVGPAIASLLFYLYMKLVPRHHFSPAEDYKYDFLTTLKALCSRNYRQKSTVL